VYNEYTYISQAHTATSQAFAGGKPMKARSLWFVDLFVIVAVFAALTAAVSPLFATARTRSALETCLDNNRQLGRAFALYEDDADGALPNWMDSNPPPAPFNTVSPTATTWDVYLMPFVKSRQVFTCPAGSLRVMRATDPADPLRSYAMPQNVSGLRPRLMKAPAKTVVLYEKGLSPCGATSDSEGEYFGQTVDGIQDTTRAHPNDPTKWHMNHGAGFAEGKVFLFADGHSALFHPIPNQQSNTNPFGYYFPGTGLSQYGTQQWPKNSAGYGYCGSADGFHGGLPTIPGANLPDKM
jgi:hypothetical protein